jgi:hypothetical protein
MDQSGSRTLPRSVKQTYANKIDAELLNLAKDAARADLTQLTVSLQRARVLARSYMHPDDRGGIL